MKFRYSILLKLVTIAIIISPMQVLAYKDNSCHLHGSYGYSYNGTSYLLGMPVPLAETGFYKVDESGIESEGILALQFSDFGGNGPLWVLINEVRSEGVITPDLNKVCSGTIEFISTGTVIKTSDPNIFPVGQILFANTPRSIAYTISGFRNQIVDLVSTAPGTIASGTAHKRRH